MEFVRFNGELHLSFYPIGEHRFMKEWSDHTVPYTFKECEDGRFEFFGYKQNDK